MRNEEREHPVTFSTWPRRRHCCICWRLLACVGVCHFLAFVGIWRLLAFVGVGPILVLVFFMCLLASLRFSEK